MERVFVKNQQEYACPEDIVITPEGDMYGWFNTMPYPGWLYMGQYDQLSVVLMIQAGCNKPIYSTKPN